MALDKKLNLRIGSLIFDCRYPLDPMALQVINLMGAQVEAEVLYLSQRVSSGMKNAKANGVVIGRPKTTKENLPAEFLEVYPQYMDGMSVTACAKRCGVSRQTFYKYLRILEQS